MKFLITIIVTALLAWLGSYYVSWWMIAVVPFLAALAMRMKGGRGFITGFLSIGLLWLYLVLKTDMANEQILSGRMSQLFGLGHTLFLTVNVLLGALIGGMGGWSGGALGRLIYADRKKYS